MDHGPGRQLQLLAVQIARCEVGFGVMVGPLSQGLFPPSPADGPLAQRLIGRPG
ncbi:hypothetical protein [Streptomyces albiflavescens]|uniref:hypothetical protein n=1 Tax=Streptomyces albiflavescens TaxID=1623582 RepID=UPI001E450643|nr:hypothetical protein [Streptomyces albiflavescens]